MSPYDNIYWYKATIIRIYDGDTIRANIDLGFGLKKENESIRLARINTPEIRGEERPAGLEAKAWLENRLKPGDEIIIKTYKWKGKYGRYIADIYVLDNEQNVININDEIVKAGHAIYQDY